MRKRSLSVFATTDSKRLSKKFEGIISDVETPSDSENEEDSGSFRNNIKDSVADNGVTESWTKMDYELLLEKLKNSLPKKDIRKYTTSLHLINWDEIAIHNYSAEEIKQTTMALLAPVRRFRTLTEMLSDLPEIINKILSAEKPKAPLSAYNLFMKDFLPRYKEEHKGMQNKDIFRLCSKAFSELSDKKKRKYEDAASRLKEEYHEKLLKFYTDHPDMAPGPKPPRKRLSSRKPKPRIKTPYNLFYESRLEISSNISESQARKEWEELPLKKKIVYIKQSYESQDAGKLLNKKEQEMLDRFHGKPEYMGRNCFEYFKRKCSAKYDTSQFNALERQRKIAEDYRKLNHRENLELKMEYITARDNYIAQYQSYIKNLPEHKRQAEIEFLRNLTEKNRKNQKTGNNNGVTKPDMYPGSADEDLPVAESTTIKGKKNTSEETLVKQEKITKKKTSHLISPNKTKTNDSTISPAEFSVKAEGSNKEKSEKKKKVEISTAIISSPLRSSNQSSSDDSDSISIEPKKRSIKSENKKAISPSKKAKIEVHEPMKEPEKPPEKIEEFYRQHIYKGKVGKHKESFAALSADKKRKIKQQLKEAQKQYIQDFERFLKTMPKDEIRRYIAKQANTLPENDDSDDDDDSDEEDDSDEPSEDD